MGVSLAGEVGTGATTIDLLERLRFGGACSDGMMTNFSTELTDGAGSEHGSGAVGLAVESSAS